MKYFLTILACIVAGFGSAQAAEQLYAATGFGGSFGELYILDPADGSVISDVGLLNDADGNNYGHTVRTAALAVTKIGSSFPPSDFPQEIMVPTDTARALL